ncbi:GNAT family N-acetyltransferase [Ornithinimicrobium murale]|uniref:GNAT family N-acetyltransferase n=1 Tax=Ornithinimicrobium murale TaxID=1050153 RepID=UPI000E0D7406|nr:GNAT family N-acetyltransferase [Ornithinimicrobium murale]
MTVPLRPLAVSLRPLTAADGEVIAGWAQDPDFCRAAEWSTALSQVEHRDFQRRTITSPPPDLLRLAAEQEGRLVGYVDLHGTEAGRRELGFLVGPRSLWGRGLGLALARSGVAHGFAVLGLREIWAEAIGANRASVRILQRLGMTETGQGQPASYLGQPSHYRRFALGSTSWDHARLRPTHATSASRAESTWSTTP